MTVAQMIAWLKNKPQNDPVMINYPDESGSWHFRRLCEDDFLLDPDTSVFIKVGEIEEHD